VATLRDILNRARWASEDLHTLRVVVVHRGAPGDQRVIAGSSILDVQPEGIEVAPAEAEAESVFVPYHRFLAIQAADGGAIWDKQHGERPRAASRADAPEPELARQERGVEVQPEGRLAGFYFRVSHYNTK
jgi:uncharacterized protein (UPF0248 family)